METKIVKNEWTWNRMVEKWGEPFAKKYTKWYNSWVDKENELFNKVATKEVMRQLFNLINETYNFGDVSYTFEVVTSRENEKCIKFESENLSMKYLESIIAILNKGGLLKSLRGKNGGYMLAREPKDYTINEILLLTEGTLAPVNCIMQEGVQCEKAATCSTLPLWAGLDKVIENYLKGITLEDIITGNRKKMLGEYCESCEPAE